MVILWVHPRAIECPGYENKREYHVHAPDFPHPADQIRTGLEGKFPWLPSRGGRLCSLAYPHQLEGLDLARAFGYMPSYRGREDLVGLNYSLGVDDEPSPVFHAGILIIDAVRSPDLASSIGKHGEGAEK